LSSQIIFENKQQQQQKLTKANKARNYQQLSIIIVIIIIIIMSNSNNDNKEELKRLVIDAISKECNKRCGSSSDDSSRNRHKDLLAIANGLAQGRELQLNILTGGLCNYSYKVNCKKNDNDNDNTDEDKQRDDVALFAKLTFGHPMVFPDTPFSLERTNYEYKMMELYANVSPYPESAVTPYFCIDVVSGDDNNDGSSMCMKLLVTQFSSQLEEQAANVFVDGGVIDTKFATKVAEGLSTLHNTEVTDPDFNKDARPFFQSLTHITASIFDGYFATAVDDDDDVHHINGATRYARSIGKERLGKILKGYRETLERSDCYIHGDSHVFNMLVEGKPPETLSDIVQSFNNYKNEEAGTSGGGDVAIIDWEMSHYGPIGKDIGYFYPFPLACAFAHAINGDLTSSNNILMFLEVLWNDYSSSIDLDDKNVSLVDVYRQVLAFCGTITLVYSAFEFHMEYLPIEDNESKI